MSVRRVTTSAASDSSLLHWSVSSSSVASIEMDAARFFGLWNCFSVACVAELDDAVCDVLEHGHSLRSVRCRERHTLMR
jgi:hypothetical protein